MTLKARIIVRFKRLKKSRIAISILDFLSPLKQTIIRTFLVSLVFINGITSWQGSIIRKQAVTMEQWADKLDGFLALFKKYGNYYDWY